MASLQLFEFQARPESFRTRAAPLTNVKVAARMRCPAIIPAKERERRKAR
jgi:hypothetical protein